MKDSWLLRFRVWAMWRVFPGNERGHCGNRWWHRFMFDRREYTLTARIISIPDTYSREEVYRMLWTVREQERRMGWLCPEPPTELLGIWQLPMNLPTIQVIVNGEPRIIVGMDVAGPDVAALAGIAWFPGLSITWRTGDAGAWGTLYGERKVAVQDGMVFNVYHTGNA